MRNSLTLTTARSIAETGLRISPQLLGAALAAAALLALLAPLPALLVDLLLALSLGAAAGVLVVAVATSNPLNLTSMPPLLVISSLVRIVLCLSVSRLILVSGEAGTLVPTLGEASAGADALAGVGILVILAVVQMVMVTSGVGRMAEVAARFALDALPGKQMGLDTAVSAGQMSAGEAQAEVRRLEREANFYGAMDGASRLLRGEAVATIVIVALTAVAGMAQGAQAGLGAAVSRYALLATGQGLVTLLPALIVTAAAALMISRSAGASSLVEEARSQMLVSPWPLVAGAIALIGLGLIPGVAMLPTLLGGAILAAAGWWVSRSERGPAETHHGPGAAPVHRSELVIEVGMGLLELVEGPSNLMEMLPALRSRVSAELGFEIPPIVVRDSLDLGATEYAIVFRSAALARGRVRPARTLAVAPNAGATPDIGTAAELPDGRTGVWINEEQAGELAELGFVLLTPIDVLVGHTEIALHRHAADIFDLEHAAALIERIRGNRPALATAASEAGLNARVLRQVCGELLWGGAPLRDPVSVVEALVEALPETGDPEKLALRARPRLAGIVTDRLTVDGRIRAVVPAPELQEELADAAFREDARTVAAMMPGRSAAWVTVLDQIGAEHGWGRPLAAIAEPGALLALQSLCRRTSAPITAVRAIDLAPEAEVEHVARIDPEQLT